jgi:hypothetical protein
LSHDWSPRIEIHRHGREQQPVIVIDDYARDPDQLIEEAARERYRPIGPYYPGVRALAPPALAASVRNSLAELIQKTFGVDDRLNRIECYFSLITTPPEQLELLQRLPHFDGLGAERIAVLHHLSRAEQGATAFYRHRSTGFESLSAERLPAYNLAVNAEFHRRGVPQSGYIAGDTPIWEQIARYEARFNRLLVYRGATLHAAEVPSGLPLPADPRTGRFSINTFLWLEA